MYGGGLKAARWDQGRQAEADAQRSRVIGWLDRGWVI